MGETADSRQNFKNESLAIVGIGLTAAALGISFLSYFVFGIPAENRDSLYTTIVDLLTRVNGLFIWSSLFALTSYLLCYVRDLTKVASGNEFWSTLGLAVSLIGSLLLLFWGIVQLMVTIPMLKGVS